VRSTLGITIAGVFVSLGSTSSLHAQPAPAPGPATGVPRLVWFAGTFRAADGSPPAPSEVVTLSIYHDDAGGPALWQETQSVAVADGGRFNVLLGSSTPDGLPEDLFASGEPRWLGVSFHRVGQEQPRVQLVSVPYALKAIDADTLGGRPASAYALAQPFVMGGAVPAAPGTATRPSGSNPTASTATVGSAGHFGPRSSSQST
jgi:hypothetical protein